MVALNYMLTVTETTLALNQARPAADFSLVRVSIPHDWEEIHVLLCVASSMPRTLDSNRKCTLNWSIDSLSWYLVREAMHGL